MNTEQHLPAKEPHKKLQTIKKGDYTHQVSWKKYSKSQGLLIFCNLRRTDDPKYIHPLTFWFRVGVFFVVFFVRTPDEYNLPFPLFVVLCGPLAGKCCTMFISWPLSVCCLVLGRWQTVGIWRDLAVKAASGCGWKWHGTAGRVWKWHRTYWMTWMQKLGWWFSSRSIKNDTSDITPVFISHF